MKWIGINFRKLGNMKQTYLFALVALAMFSCSKPQIVVNTEPQPLKYNFSIAEKPSIEAETKALKKSWDEGDKVYIVFDDATPKSLGDFMILKYTAGEWEVEQPSTSLPSASGGTLDALYYDNANPRGSFTDDADGGTFYFETSMGVYGQYLFFQAENVPYTVEDGTVSSSFSLDFEPNNVRTYVQFRITGLEGEWQFFSEDFVNTDNTFAAWGPVWQKLNHRFTYDDSILYTWKLNERTDGHYIYLSTQQNADAITITLMKENGANAGYYQKSFNKKISGKFAAVTFKGPQFDDNGVPTNGWKSLTAGNDNGHTYVDLGGDALWATVNLGSNKYQDSGDNYAWAETETYYTNLSPDWKEGKEKGYAIESYKYAELVGEDYLLNKYTAEGGGETLEPEDDAASVNWSGDWRTPSATEWKWLRENCTWKSIYPDCLKVTSNKEGYEQHFIIIPKGGHFEGVAFSGKSYYMSSTSTQGGAYAFEVGSQVFYSAPRCWGFSVRPVRSK